MGFLKGLFGGRSGNSSQACSEDTATLQWYFAEDAKKSVRQVVLEIPPTPLTKSRFGILMLGQKYMSLLTSDWTIGFFRLDGDPGPHLLVRARHDHETMNNHATRLAFSFYRMRRAGVLALFWDCPDKVGQWPYGHVEGASTTDQPQGIDIVKDAIKKEALQITFAVHSLRASADYGGQEVSIPEAVSDVTFKIPTSFRDRVLLEIDELNKYHKSLSGPANGTDAMNQMWADNPTDKTAVLSKSR